jgi:RNA polymerase sigma factor (sigma-70 family)
MAATADTFATFYETEQPRVLRAVTLILGDATRASRITHESFVRTHSAWRRVDGDRAFVHTMRCAFRLAWRARANEEITVVLDDDLLDATTRPQPVANTSTIDLRDELRDEIETRDLDLELALGSLPRAQRSVIVFWYYVGLEEPTIAEVMSIRETQVALHLERARTRLSALLGEDRSGVA